MNVFGARVFRPGKAFEFGETLRGGLHFRTGMFPLMSFVRLVAELWKIHFHAGHLLFNFRHLKHGLPLVA